MGEYAGNRLGKYQIIEEIGRGGMAVVYKAFDTELQRTVALKVLHEHFRHDTRLVQRFLREARHAAKLHHSSIIAIYDVHDESGLPYFAMQHVEHTLHQLLRQRGRLPLEETVRIIKQIASALDHAHGRGYVHRDVKPSNILVSASGQAFLSDFGIVKAADDTTLTETGAIIGTPEYMSPEQIRGWVLDRRSDIYSLGVVCYEMLAGRVPFSGETASVLYAHVNELPAPVQKVNPHVPVAVAQVVRKALAKKKERRHETAGRMGRALERAVTGRVNGAPTRMPTVVKAALVGVTILIVLVGAVNLIPRCAPTPEPSGTVASTPTSTPVSGMPTPTGTSTPPRRTPTKTPIPTATDITTPTAVPPTPTCSRAVDRQLAGLWSRSRLGCPAAPGDTIWAAWQRFERGYMFWRSDTRRVTVFFDNRTWTEFRDQWMEGAPIPSRGSPPPGLLAPTRGFGYIWGIHDSVASGIGWALEGEKGFCTKIQLLERGFIFRSSTVTFCQDQLYNWATHPSFRPLFFAVYSDATWEQR